MVKGSYSIAINGVVVSRFDNLITQAGRARIVNGNEVTSHKLVLSTSTEAPKVSDEALEETLALEFISQNNSKSSPQEGIVTYKSALTFGGVVSSPVENLTKVGVLINGELFSVAFLPSQIALKAGDNISATYTLTMTSDLEVSSVPDTGGITPKEAPEPIDLFAPVIKDTSVDGMYVSVTQGVTGSENYTNLELTYPYSDLYVLRDIHTNRGSFEVRAEAVIGDANYQNFYSSVYIRYDFGG